eukprot:CAMPEP_0201599852 /NCGR_PEP_ID=MMETSP0492-20130828/1145_1 /ASSEMBLY_ACC=CAM_ASM_000837 /TAXON_ID=420259 /ORGANISM="Thalassiosira gravida, Strain GMp14c1" /LENGTH=159 /DNA_ID=CAMNT_0048062505 /DNA_START=62 /DNA_END=541 /DNA_ORIENTATION=+
MAASALFLPTTTSSDLIGDNIDAFIHSLSHDPVTDDPCNSKAAALRRCMESSSSSGDPLGCAKCMMNGLDYTHPITCAMLGTGESDSDGNSGYCVGVVECVDLKCGEDCRDEYYEGLDCTIQQSCADVACTPVEFQTLMTRMPSSIVSALRVRGVLAAT